MSLCCCSECWADGEKDFIGGALGQMLITRDRAATHVMEHLVDGLANHMRFAAASRAGSNIGCASHND
jgi:hypothetical protein